MKARTRIERSRRQAAWAWVALAVMAWCWLGTLAAHGQSQFIARNYKVRISVKNEVEKLALQGTGAYQVINSAGRGVAIVRAQEPYFVQITRGRKGDSIFRIVLREMNEHQVEDAINFAKQAKDEYKMPVKVVRIPAREKEESRILVMLGEFTNYDAARVAAGRIKGVAIQFIYEDRARAREGQVRLLARDGTIVATDGHFLKLIPTDMTVNVIALRDLGPGEWTPGAMSEGRRYRGDIELTINEEGTLTAVNDLWIEYYLYSVVAAEIGDDAPFEAMKAQAVAARSEAVSKIQRGIVSSSFFDFYDTPMCQAYPGVGKETALVRRAVDATRGELLVSHGEAIDAVYSHCCGGVMASLQDMWDGPPASYAPRGMDQLGVGGAPNLSDFDPANRITAEPLDALCRPDQPGYPSYGRKYYRWTKTYNGQELTSLLSRSYGTGRVRDLIVDRRTPSGRVRRIKIVGDNKTVEIHRELELRESLGDLYSTFFTFDKEQDESGHISRLTIHGAGFGHGVGMCQMGAWMMGLKGYNYRQILAHYFKDVKIRKLYR